MHESMAEPNEATAKARAKLAAAGAEGFPVDDPEPTPLTAFEWKTVF